MDQRLIYLDNAATSWPKPPQVAEAMVTFLDQVGANPGRSGHRLSVAAGRVVYEAREALADLLHAPDPLRIAFGLNATDALNLTLHGLLRPGDHVVTSSMEHNSVMRPLRALERQGVQVTVVSSSPQGFLDPGDVEQALRPHTRMVVVTHASNVVGTLLPIRELGEVARRHGVLFAVDAAQTAGAVSIDMEADRIDILCFTGHKALLGPMGTGGLVLGERVAAADLKPVKQGGTGSRSEHEEHPDFLPDLCEAGTPNAVGLAGLLAGVRWVQGRGVEAIRAHEQALTARLLEGLAQVPRVVVYGPQDPARQTGIVSFNLEGMEPSEVGLLLDEEYGILCRVGLHCAPAAHRTLGTFPRGTVRFAVGCFTTLEQVDAAVEAVQGIARLARS